MTSGKYEEMLRVSHHSDPVLGNLFCVLTQYDAPVQDPLQVLPYPSLHPSPVISSILAQSKPTERKPSVLPIFVSIPPSINSIDLDLISKLEPRRHRRGRGQANDHLWNMKHRHLFSMYHLNPWPSIVSYLLLGNSSSTLNQATKCVLQQLKGVARN
jgi:hypothetical protein